MNEQSILKRAIDKWGEKSQIEMLQEEATELALAARKYNRKLSADAKQNLLEEIADVEIMIAQVKIMYPDAVKEIQKVKNFKLNRLDDRLNKNSFE